MPMHDWTRVPAGIYHAFHNTWIGDLQKALNAGVLPADYYALGEQRSGGMGPDVLTLHDEGAQLHDWESLAHDDHGMIAVAERPPKVRLVEEAAEDAAFYLARRRTIVIRHVSGDRVVALLEIVSPANKHDQYNLDDFVDKAVIALRDDIHVLIIDPFPPRRCDPAGIHGAIWERLMAGAYDPPDGFPLTLVSYCARQPIQAYVEPLQVGDALTEMPLFLTPGHYVPAPLEATYHRAYEGLPRRWKRVIEGQA